MVPNNTNYQAIRQELDSGAVKEDLWMRAYSQARGSHSKAVSIYITLRAEELYQENTSIYRRTGHSLLRTLDLRTRQGRLLNATILLVAAISLLLLVQPILNSAAAGSYSAVYEKARTAQVIGRNQTFLFQQLGKPASTQTTESTLTYIFNPSSFFCFQKSNYDLKVFVDLQTGLVTGLQSSTFFEEKKF